MIISYVIMPCIYGIIMYILYIYICHIYNTIILKELICLVESPGAVFAFMYLI